MRIKFRQVRIVLLAVCVGAAIWAGVWWVRYPNVPNVKTVSPDEAMAFIGTDDFNRMTERHRMRYALAATERLREKPFEELVAMMLKADPSRKQIQENL